MTLPACNPRLGYGVTSALATYYPERLGLVVCINHNPVFQGVWNAFKVFLHPNTVAKMQLLRKKTKYRAKFADLFDEELATWLIEEVKLNKLRPMAATQRQFWKSAGGNEASGHDPRGCPSYIRRYVDTFLSDVRSDYKRNNGRYCLHTIILNRFYSKHEHSLASFLCHCTASLELATVTLLTYQSADSLSVLKSRQLDDRLGLYLYGVCY